MKMSPKCHPELAGHGIEYCWGGAKMFFRRNNDLVPANFEKSVRTCLAHVTRRKVHLFERRARAYRACLTNPDNDTFVKIENAVKERKVHRNAADFDGKFIRETMLESEVVAMECEQNEIHDQILSDHRFPGFSTVFSGSDGRGRAVSGGEAPKLSSRRPRNIPDTPSSSHQIGRSMRGQNTLPYPK